MEKELLGVGSRVKHPAFAEGVIIRLHLTSYEICFIQFGIKLVGKDYVGMEIIELIEAEEKVTFTDAEKSLIRILKTWSDFSPKIELGQKWVDGEMILQPGDRSMKAKVIPVDTFFHKIVMTRDRLRVLEQNINAHKVLTDEEKINLQQYITKVYGSLTTFNDLFKNKSDHFVGERSE
ncbi:MAG: hypothetical protein ABIV51_11410 [Saprospiraceae bacterium]